jgi:hypothetical protein
MEAAKTIAFQQIAAKGSRPLTFYLRVYSYSGVSGRV